MKRVLPKVTRQEVIEAACSALAEGMYHALAIPAMILPCLTEEAKSTGHFCYYNVLLERGWIERAEETAPDGAYYLKRLGADSWCKQYLTHGFEEGPLVDVVKETFDRSEVDYKEWRQIVMDHKVGEALEDGTN